MGFFSSSKTENVEVKPQEIVLGKLYCIDFENISDPGIIGISKLTDKDEVVIFYGSNNKSISFVSHEMIVLANCKVTIMKCEKSAKNYLDFQLVSYIGMRLGKENFEQVVIVSKDTGFDSVIDFWTTNGANIARQEAIDPSIKSEPKAQTTSVKNKKSSKKPVKKQEKKQEVKSEPKVEEKPVEISEAKPEKKTEKKSLPDGVKKKVRNAVKTAELKPTQYTLIYNTIMRSKTIDDYKTYTKKRLGDKGEIVFEKTKDIFADYQANK